MKIIKIKPHTNYIIKGQLWSHGSGQPGDKAKDLAPGVIYIEKGNVAAILPAPPDKNSYQFKKPGQPLVTLDLQQLTIIPPLVDCHVHLALDGLNFPAARRRWQQPRELDEQIRRQLNDTLACGIAAVRDGGDLPGIAGDYRRLTARGDLTGPWIKCSVHGLRPPGSYGSFLGPDLPMDQVAGMLDQLARQNADVVKVIVSGVVSFKEYGQVGPVHYTQPELDYIVHQARRRGLPVMAHASSNPAVAMAVKAGVDTIEHGYFVEKHTLEQMAEQNIAWIPTVIPVAAQLDKNNPAADQINHYVVEKTVHRQLAMLGLAMELGVTVGVGTDAGAAGVPHGFSYHRELQLYQKAGLTPAQIYHSAVVNGAQLLKLPWGQIAPGQAAALLAVPGHPLQDIAPLGAAQYAFIPPRGTC